jgi:RHS repeat-associated protein
VIGEYGASAADVKAEFIWALPPAANDNSPFGGGDHIAGYAPLALVAKNASNQLELYWVHGNHLGVPIVTTNAQGQVVTPANDFLRPGFPGQSEVLADLYYNRARDYDPVLGRYIQADPIVLGGDVNPYLYANADPVNMIDPLGLFQLPAAPNPLLLRAAPQATVLYGVALTLAAANQWAMCRPTIPFTPKEESRIARLKPDPNDPCPDIKAAVQDALRSFEEEVSNFAIDYDGLTGKPGRITHLNDLRGRVQRIRDLISAGEKLGCNMSAERQALAQIMTNRSAW